MSKDFLSQHFVVGQMLSNSGNDLEKEHGSENPNFDFVTLLFKLLT